MKSKLTLVLNILLGVLLIVFGSNKFIGFLPDLAFSNPAAGELFNALASSYILKTVGLIEILIGILLVFRKIVPFALTLLAPISVNIVLFHITLDPANIAPAAFVFVVNTFLIYVNWDAYKNLFK